ncbi:hypothetical protein HOD75_03730 [archaeon]|jgi:hypothetical protein|nr:hypothetical protein [archaeon]MBT4241981.1 hypothetical protein [archaeon]MBT4418528.1 hypothetical protein [archaeon]
MVEKEASPAPIEDVAESSEPSSEPGEESNPADEGGSKFSLKNLVSKLNVWKGSSKITKILIVLFIVIIVAGLIGFFFFNPFAKEGDVENDNLSEGNIELFLQRCGNSCGGFCASIAGIYDGQVSVEGAEPNECFCSCGIIGWAYFNINTGEEIVKDNVGSFS